MRKSKKIVVLFAIFGLIITLAGMSYAYLRVRKNQESTNNIALLRCLGVDFEDKTNAVSLKDAYPVSYDEGMKTPIYNFKITNKCNTNIYAKVNLETLSLDNLIDRKHIRVWFNNDNLSSPKYDILTNFSSEAATLSNAVQSNNLIEINLGEYESEDFELRLWIDEATTWEEGKAKAYAGKITVSVSPNPNTSVTKGDFTMYAYVDGQISSTFPTSNNYNTSITCNSYSNNTSDIVGTASWNGSKWLVNISSLDSGDTVCNVYFTKKSDSEVEAPSNWYTAKEGTLLAAIRKNYASATATGTTPGSAVSSAGEKVLAGTADDYGTSYYFRGAVTNNYVQFANKCWRIVRITGNGAIKLVLHNDNTGKVANPCDAANNNTNAAFARYSGTTYTSAFNTSKDKNAHVGFMYGTPGSSTYAAEHENKNDSTILINLKAWYDSNLKSYKDKLADTIWCNDKSTYKNTSYNPWSIGTIGTNYGVGTNVNYYSATSRFVASGGNPGGTGPTLVCSKDNLGGKLSKYTANDTINGNGKLNGYKIGLLSADEVVFAGGVRESTNNSYYLYENTSSSWWWTMSPSHFNSNGAAFIVCVSTTGGIEDSWKTGTTYAVRPAISLIPTITISSGTGTSSDPFIISS